MRAIRLLCVVVLLAIGGAMFNSMSNSLKAQTAVGVRTQIEQIIDAQAAAWNRGDAAAWASAFSDDADFINIRGDVFHGREAIAQQHARIFAGPYKGSHATITIRRVTEPAPGVALIETDHEVRGFAMLPPGIAPTAEGVLRTRMKYVAVERDGHWQMIAAQNTAVLPAAGMPAAPGR